MMSPGSTTRVNSMLVKPAKPASGLAIRNAFQYAAIEILGDKRYVSSHEQPRGFMRLEFSEDKDSPALTYGTGDSVRISNSKGKTVRLALIPVQDEQLYEEFEILARDVSSESEYDVLCEFEVEIIQLISKMNRRLSMWVKDSTSAEDA
jgi:hypothetical protein